MSHKLPNYLISYRKRAGLTQDELAVLVGYYSGEKISRHERSIQIPTLQAVLAYEVIFSAPTSELFAGLLDRTRRQIKHRARTLLAKAGKSSIDKKTIRKMQLLKTLCPEERPKTVQKS